MFKISHSFLKVKKYRHKIIFFALIAKPAAIRANYNIYVFFRFFMARRPIHPQSSAAAPSTSRMIIMTFQALYGSSHFVKSKGMIRE